MATVGSLFAGIGGFDLGFERQGYDIRWQVENDEYCQRVLRKHWPLVERFHDVCDCGAWNLPPVDVITGGFPCQDVSDAGERAGIDGDRSGLWREMCRIISELRPQFALVENVPGLFVRGLDRVLGDLAEIGYDAEWQVISAADVGAPHLRKRVWIVAHPEGVQSNGGNDNREGIQRSASIPKSGNGSGESHVGDSVRGGCSGLDGRGPGTEPADGHPQLEERGDVAHAALEGLEGYGRPSQAGGFDRQGASGNPSTGHSQAASETVANAVRSEQGPLFRGHPGLGRQWESLEGQVSPGEPGSQWGSEPNVGRVAHGVPSRVDRLKGLGNAVVPQIVEHIGHLIQSHSPHG